jgi:hypothetical protein
MLSTLLGRSRKLCRLGDEIVNRNKRLLPNSLGNVKTVKRFKTKHLFSYIYGYITKTKAFELLETKPAGTFIISLDENSTMFKIYIVLNRGITKYYRMSFQQPEHQILQMIVCFPHLQNYLKKDGTFADVEGKREVQFTANYLGQQVNVKYNKGGKLLSVNPLQ